MKPWRSEGRWAGFTWVCIGAALWGAWLTTRVGAANVFDEDWTPPQRSGAAAVVLPMARQAGTRPVVGRGDVANAGEKAGAVPVKARLGVPGRNEQGRARKVMREVYAKELSDRSAAGRGKLAEQLLGEAAKAADNPVDRFVLLCGALEAAKDSGNLGLCRKTAEALAQAFDVDGLAVRADAALAAKYAGASAGETAQNVVAGLELVEELASAEEFPSATRLCAVLQGAAANSPMLRSTVQQKSREIAALRMARERLASHVETLKRTPDDPAANLAVGSYLCLVKEQWDAGLPLLARGGNPALRAAAVGDLAAPTGVDAQIAVGDAWWNAAEKEAPGAQAALHRRAAVWYGKALESGQVTGVSRLRLEKRIAAIPQSSTPGFVVKPGPSQWISQGASYTASSQGLKSAPPLPSLLDGRGGGHHVSGVNAFAFHTKKENEPYIVIDLAGPCVITSLEIGNRPDADQDRDRTLTVWVSSDPAGPWQEIWRAADVQKLWTVTLDQPARGRFLKMGLREAEIFQLFSVKVLGQKIE